MDNTRDSITTKPDGTRRHPGVCSLLKEIGQYHLADDATPSPLVVVAPALGLAYCMADLLPEGPELTAGLRKLLEAEDCFLRAQRALK